ncbi:MAG: carbohydrate ABC transporter permease [Lachnospiraceae bacterium]|nr:carbohydrate ABC transporter permease [Lachnospiraceae bacterium]
MKKSRETQKRKQEKTSLPVHIFFLLFGLICLIPFITVVSASFSSELDLARYGFRVLPKKWDLTAYKYLFENPKMVLNAYGVTIFITVVGTVFGVLFMAMVAFCLARSSMKLKSVLTFYIYFPTLFSGGLTASYIINTQYLNLTNSLAALVAPGLINIFNVFMIRTFLKQQPASLFEAAKIDGASEYAIFFRIALPLAKPVLATVAFLTALDKWNEWYNSMLYIRDNDKITLQHMLQRMMNNINVLMENMDNIPMGVNLADIPGENLRMAMLIVSIGPMMCFFPFFQKYFTKGMTVGAIKG